MPHKQFPFTGKTPQIGAKALYMGPEAPQIGQSKKCPGGTLISNCSGEKVILAFNLKRRVASVR